KQFDGHGNYTFGLNEQLVFPEIDYDKIDSVRGMNVTIVTTAETDAQGLALLTVLGFPFRRDGQGGIDGQEGTREQAAAQAEVQGARLHALPPVRPGAVGVPRLRAVPPLSPADGSRRGDPGHDEELVVTGRNAQ